jgi:hypothetical protein
MTPAETRPTRAEGLGRHFVMLRDGVMSAGCLGDPVLAGETFLLGVEGLIKLYTPEWPEVTAVRCDAPA